MRDEGADYTRMLAYEYQKLILLLVDIETQAGKLRKIDIMGQWANPPLAQGLQYLANNAFYLGGRPLTAELIEYIKLLAKDFDGKQPPYRSIMEDHNE